MLRSLERRVAIGVDLVAIVVRAFEFQQPSAPVATKGEGDLVTLWPRRAASRQAWPRESSA